METTFRPSRILLELGEPLTPAKIRFAKDAAMLVTLVHRTVSDRPMSVWQASSIVIQAWLRFRGFQKI